MIVVLRLLLASMAVGAVTAMSVGACMDGHKDARTRSVASSTQTAQCHARGTGLFVLPDKSKACTPGAWVDSLRDAQKHVCTPRWNEDRTGAAALKTEVMKLYGVPVSDRSKVESDHYFPVWLGGATTRANLWPEPNDPAAPANGFVHNPKDALEVGAKGLYHRVCVLHSVTVGQARRAFEGNWVTSYRKYVGPTTSAR